MSFDDQRLVIINFYIIYWLFLLCFCVLSIVKRTGTLSDSFNLLIVNIYTWLHCDTFLKYTTTTKIIIVRQVSNIHVKRCTNNKMKIKREKSCVVNKKKTCWQRSIFSSNLSWKCFSYKSLWFCSSVQWL